MPLRRKRKAGEVSNSSNHPPAAFVKQNVAAVFAQLERDYRIAKAQGKETGPQPLQQWLASFCQRLKQ